MTLPAQSDTTELIALAVLVLLVGWVLLRTYRRLSRQKKDDSVLVHTARPQQADRDHHLDAPPEVARWEVQMHETARELAAQLDSKLSVLQALIAEADRASARLEAAVARSAELAQPTEQPDADPASRAEAMGPSIAPERPAEDADD